MKGAVVLPPTILMKFLDALTTLVSPFTASSAHAPAGRRPAKVFAQAIASFAVVGLALACGPNDGLVGGACNDHRDCKERCLEGKDYPGGMCTVDCRDDRDCPGGTYCTDKSGGVCLLACGNSGDCPGGYVCKDLDAEGGPGKIPVCIGD